jgi:gamma-polyglutamate biosynthesis protein CapA
LDGKFYLSQLRITWLNRAAGLLAALICIFSVAPEPQILKITFLGDVMLGRSIDRIASRTKNWQPFQKLFPITEWADILAANLESPLTTAPVETSGYALCASPTRVGALKAASFDLVSLSNNHIQDCGDSGVIQTRLTLQSSGILAAGPNPEIIKINSHGYKLAVLALDDVLTGVDLPTVIPIVKSAALESDLVIISIHWGSEYQPAPSVRQRALAAMLAEAGADIIVGHHPHVIQPVENLTRGPRLSSTLVFYSLGNALFDQHGLSDTRTGEAVSLILGPGGTLQYSINTFEIDPDKAIIQKILP